MTNKEKYAKEILELAANTGMFGLKNGKPALCKDIKCGECDFYDKSYKACKSFRKWLNSEYVEPPVDWSNVAVDTPILVRDNENDAWRRRHFAKYENGMVCTWGYGATSWSADSDNVCDWKMAKLAESEE